jgi:hypothetical protein
MPESGSGKIFHASKMRAINFSHKITPDKLVFKYETFFQMQFRKAGHFSERPNMNEWYDLDCLYIEIRDVDEKDLQGKDTAHFLSRNR